MLIAKSRLTISAGGMQTIRAIIDMYAYKFVLSMSVCEKKQNNKERS